MVEEHTAGLLAQYKGSLTVERPLPLVKGNLTVLVQILTNLVGNGLKFVSPDTRPAVRIWSERRSKRVRVWVADTGIGIAPEHHKRLFELFQRLHVVAQLDGTTIGLAAFRTDVARLGGIVGV